MTISVEEYFQTSKLDRKKENRYIAVINKNSCTSCGACSTMCPVDCIYEVPSPTPSQSYHAVDTARCIACQLCYRVPQMSTARYTMTICPWNAIDMLNNPTLEGGEFVLQPYYVGNEPDVPWGKLEELGYQLFQNEHLRIRSGDDRLKAAVQLLQQEDWSWGEGRFAAVGEPEEHGPYLLYRTTPPGLAMLQTAFDHYSKIFLD